MWIFDLIIGLWASSVVLEFVFADEGPPDLSSYIHGPNLHP
jgi:hypothetical protein